MKTPRRHVPATFRFLDTLFHRWCQPSEPARLAAKRHRRIFLEPLEDRRLLASLLATLDGAGNLTIIDIDGGNRDNHLAVSISGSNLVISDSAEAFVAAPSGGVLTNGGKTVTLPLASVTGTLSIDTAGGSDDLTTAALPGFLGSLAIGTPEHPLASATTAGEMSLATAKSFTVFSKAITVSGAVTTSGGAVNLSAQGDLALSAPVTTNGGSLQLNADSDGDGSGTLTLAPTVLASWTEQEQVNAFAGAANEGFAHGVAISRDGKTAVVGTPYDATKGSEAGAAYIFEYTNGSWVQQSKLLASDGQPSDQFGKAAAISDDGNTVVVGAAINDVVVGGTNFVDRGSAYVFKRSGTSWSQVQLVSTSGAVNDAFGTALAISGDGQVVVVGAPGHDATANDNQGSAFVFKWDGTTWTQRKQLNAANGAVSDVFGRAVAISQDGQTVLLGAYRRDVPDPANPPAKKIDQGSAFVFTGSDASWSLQAELTASDGTAGGFFGFSVALSADGNTALVGVEEAATSNANTAYVFTRSGTNWSQQARLGPSSSEAGDGFGEAVALSSDGNTALVGAFHDDLNGRTNQGSAFIFKRSGTTWIQQTQLTASSGSSDDWFGNAVALSGDGLTALVGAYFDDVAGRADQGSAFGFTQDPVSATWTEKQQLNAFRGVATEGFGRAVAISRDGTTAVVGVSYDDTRGNDAGSAYIFVSSNGSWVQQAKLFASDGVFSDEFGNAVAISDNGNTVLIGAQQDDVAGVRDQGSAYVYVRTGANWSEQSRLSFGAIDDLFGNSVALSGDGNVALSGAPGDDVGSVVNQGSAYVFTRSGTTWNTSPAQLTATGGASGDVFGRGVAMSSDGATALVGAYRRDLSGKVDQGAAYVFTRSGTAWSQQASLTAADGAAGDLLGAAVALSADGNTVLIGVETGGTVNPNSVYVFSRTGTTWSQQAKLNPSGGDPGDGFGQAVALSSDGNTALIGAFLDDIVGKTNQGSAFFFKRSGTAWTQQTQIAAANGASDDWFGNAVTLSGDGLTALVGAYLDDVAGRADQGSVYSFTQDLGELGGSLNANSGVLVLSAADMDLQDAMVTTSDAVIRPSQPGRPIQLGGIATGSLNLSDAELDRITSGNLFVGVSTSGPLTIASDLSQAGRNLTLRTGAGVSGAGAISNGSATQTTVTIDQPANSIYSGSLGGPASGTSNDKNLAFIKSGVGTLTLAGNSSLTGTTSVNSGRLLVNGSLDNGPAAADVIVASGATLGGTGTIFGDIQVNSGGKLAPGSSAGVLHTGSVTFQDGSLLEIEIGGVFPGNAVSNHDQISVSGGVTIGPNVTLALSWLGGFVPQSGQSFMLIDNDGPGPGDRSGTFSGLPEGTVLANFLGSGLNAVLRYAGGNGNDFLLSVEAPNHPPVVSGPITVTASEDDPSFSLNLLLNASDPNTDNTLNVSGLSLVSGNASGIAVSGNNLIITPAAYRNLAPGENVVIAYAYNILDGQGGSVSQTATITVEGRADGTVIGEPLMIGGFLLTNATLTNGGSNLAGDSDLPLTGIVHLVGTVQNGQYSLSVIIPHVNVGSFTLNDVVVTLRNNGAGIAGRTTLPILGSVQFAGSLNSNGTYSIHGTHGPQSLLNGLIDLHSGELTMTDSSVTVSSGAGIAGIGETSFDGTFFANGRYAFQAAIQTVIAGFTVAPVVEFDSESNPATDSALLRASLPLDVPLIGEVTFTGIYDDQGFWSLSAQLPGELSLFNGMVQFDNYQLTLTSNSLSLGASATVLQIGHADFEGTLFANGNYLLKATVGASIAGFNVDGVELTLGTDELAVEFEYPVPAIGVVRFGGSYGPGGQWSLSGTYPGPITVGPLVMNDLMVRLSNESLTLGAVCSIANLEAFVNADVTATIFYDGRFEAIVDASVLELGNFNLANAVITLGNNNPEREYILTVHAVAGIASGPNLALDGFIDEHGNYELSGTDNFGFGNVTLSQAQFKLAKASGLTFTADWDYEILTAHVSGTIGNDGRVHFEGEAALNGVGTGTANVDAVVDFNPQAGSLVVTAAGRVNVPLLGEIDLSGTIHSPTSYTLRGSLDTRTIGGLRLTSLEVMLHNGRVEITGTVPLLGRLTVEGEIRSASDYHLTGKLSSSKTIGGLSLGSIEVSLSDSGFQLEGTAPLLGRATFTGTITDSTHYQLTGALSDDSQTVGGLAIGQLKLTLSRNGSSAGSFRLAGKAPLLGNISLKGSIDGRRDFELTASLNDSPFGVDFEKLTLRDDGFDIDASFSSLGDFALSGTIKSLSNYSLTATAKNVKIKGATFPSVKVKLTDDGLTISGSAKLPGGTVSISIDRNGKIVLSTPLGKVGGSLGGLLNPVSTVKKSIGGWNGILGGSTVFFDANKNLVLDEFEAWAYTDSTGRCDCEVSSEFDLNGNGILDNDEGQWVLQGGIDISTGLPAVTTLVSPATWNVISPLTNLVAVVAANPSVTLDQASNRVLSAFSLPQVDLGNFDPIAETLAGNPDGAAVYAAHARLQDSIAQIAALFDPTDDPELDPSLTNQIVAAIAGSIGTSTSPLDFAESALFVGILNQVAATEGTVLDQTLIGGVAEVIAATNREIDRISDAGGLDLLKQIAQVKVTSQQVVAEALSLAAAGETDIQTVIEQNTGAALAQQIAATAIPPVIVTPYVILAEATGQSGAIVDFSVRANDIAGQAVPASVSQASGTFFSLGDATVSVAATDSRGVTATASFIVSVVDTTPPELDMPAEITVAPHSPDGAYVTLPLIVAHDLVDTSPIVTLDTESGFFPLGTTEVTVTATDASGNKIVGTLLVTVIDGDVPELPPSPQPADLNIETAEDSPVRGNLPATNTAGSSLSYAVQEGPLNGSVVLTADGSFAYVPEPNYHGADFFTYEAVDEQGETATGEVRITITSINDLPTITAALVSSVSEDASSYSLDLLAGASDGDVDDILGIGELTLVSGHNRGVIANGNRLMIDPGAYNDLAAGEMAIITYAYNIFDGHGGSVGQTASIIIQGRNDRPTVGAPLDSTSSEDAAVYRIELLAGASDLDTSDGLAVSSLTLLSGDGSGIAASGNSLTIDPQAYNGLAVGQQAVITYSYRVVDGHGGIAFQTATITITGTNDTPQALDYVYAADEDGSAAGNLLAGATDPDVSDSLVVMLVTGSGNSGAAGQTVSTAFGAVTLFADGSFRYQPGLAGESTSDSFTYTISDGHGGTVTATVHITITQYVGVSIVGGVLRVGGGETTDNITVSGGGLVVNGVAHSLAGVTEIRIWGRGSNDTIDLTGLAVPVFVHGGSGNDRIVGGIADDVIFGGDGDDNITGESGHDFLIGGDGKDRIIGSAGNDILVANDMECDLDLDALRDISHAWASSRSVTDETVDDLLDESVLGDLDSDQLTGSSGADLFIINSGDKITDFQFGKLSTNKDGDAVIKDGLVTA